MQYDSAKLPDAKILWSPRVGFNGDVSENRSTQLRGGTGIFTGKPLFVWISNQIGNTGVLTGFSESPTADRRGRSIPNPDAYKPTNVTGAPAANYELALTDENFKFPQVWRSNIAVDHRLPWNITGTAEFLYNRDVNGVYYINANLPAAQTTFVGAETAALDGPAAPQRHRPPPQQLTGNQISNATVMKNQNVGRSWNSVSRREEHDLMACWRPVTTTAKQEHGRPGFDRVRLVERQRALERPEQPGTRVRGRVTGPPLLPDRLLPQGILRVRRDSFSAFWESRTIGNPATSSPAT